MSSRVWAFVAAGLLASAALAQNAETAPPDPPNPARLEAAWAEYLVAEGDALEQRVDALVARLRSLAEQLPESLTPEERERVELLIDELAQLAPRLVQARARSAPAVDPLSPPEQRYGPGRLLEIGLALREARLELEFERDEVEREKQILDELNTRINDAKAAYLALPTEAPERLVAGLSLMRDRVAWAVRKEDLRVRTAHANALAEHEARLAERLAAASERLTIDAAARERAEKALRAAQAESARLRDEATQLRLRDEGYGDTSPEGRARSRRQSQALLQYEVRTAQAELEAARAQLVQALGEQLQANSTRSVELLRAERKALDQRLAALRTEVDVWRRASERERSAASAQLALLEGTDARLGEIHRSRVHRADETLQSLNALEQVMAGSGLLLQVTEKRLVEDTGRFEDLFARGVDALGNSWSTIKVWANASLFEINETPVTLMGLLRVVLILAIAWWASKLVGGAIGRLMQRRDSMSRASLYTLQRLSTYTILALGFFIGLSSIGIDFTKFALVISALGVGLGFGLQAIFSNFVAGLIILFEKSLKVGDFVELESGVHGEVREINIRSTLVTTNDNIDILVPNSEFVNGRVTNWTLREAFRRIRVPFGVAYGTDKETVKQAALEAADAVPYTLKNMPGRGPQVWLVNFGESSLDFELIVWLTTDAVKRPSTVHAAYTWEIETALARHGIEIPFPQRDLHVRSVFGQKDDAGLSLLPQTPAEARGGGDAGERL